MKKPKMLLIAAILVFAAAMPVIADNEVNPDAEVIKTDFMMLVNKKNLLDENYIPGPLTNIAKSVSSTKGEIMLQQEVAEQYIQMVQAMKADGISLTAVSGYRTYQYQKNLYINKINYYKKYYPEEEAKIRAGQVVAPPGASEHQTGLAIDVSVSSVGYALDGRFQNTKAYGWLMDNGYKYGFIIRYQEEKKEITDIIFEPWHLRYVGTAYAEDIYSKNICLEEYIEQKQAMDNMEKEANYDITVK